MNEKDWEKFFDLVNKIVDAPATYKEKRAELHRKAEEYSCEINLEELGAWISDD